MRERYGLEFRAVAAPSTVNSSIVMTLRRTPPTPSGVAITVASARNGCARSTRSDSARRSSEHSSPRWSSRNRRIIGALLVTCS
jgi:hypothetical protein